MEQQKRIILEKLGYTALVYGRVNKKLATQYSKKEIEALICKTIQETEVMNFCKRGKNYYISNQNTNIRVTVNSNTFSVITADKLK